MDLYVRLLGLPRIVLDGEPVHFPFRKLEALALVVFDQGDVTRDRLCSLLWGDKGDPGARKNLRNGLDVLRRLLPEETVQMDRTRVWVPREAPLRRDRDLLLRFEHLSDEQREALGRPFLEEFDPEDSSPFADWVLQRREEYRRDYLERVKRYAASLMDRQDPAGATRWYERLLALDPLDEEAVRQLMRLYHASGWAAGPLGIYESLQDRLEREYQTGPAPETRELYREILAAGRSPETDFHGIALPRETGLSLREEEGFPVHWRGREGAQCLDLWNRSPHPRLLLVGEEGSGKGTLAERLLRALDPKGDRSLRCLGISGPGVPPAASLRGLWETDPPGGALETGELAPRDLAMRLHRFLEERGLRVLLVERFDLLDGLAREALGLLASLWDGGWILTEEPGGPGAACLPGVVAVTLEPLGRGEMGNLGSAEGLSLSQEEQERILRASGGNLSRIRVCLDRLGQGLPLPSKEDPFAWCPPLPPDAGRDLLERLALTPQGEDLEALGSLARQGRVSERLREGWLTERVDSRGRLHLALRREENRRGLLRGPEAAARLAHREALEVWAARAREAPLDGSLWERAAFHASGAGDRDRTFEARVRGYWARGLVACLPWPPFGDPELRVGGPGTFDLSREEAENLLREGERRCLALGSSPERRLLEPLLRGILGWAAPGEEGRESLSVGWDLALRLKDWETAGALALALAERFLEEGDLEGLHRVLERFFLCEVASRAPVAAGHFLRLAGTAAERQGRHGAARSYRRGALGWFRRRERTGAGQTLGRLAAGLDLAESMLRRGERDQIPPLLEALEELSRERGVLRGRDRLLGLREALAERE